MQPSEPVSIASRLTRRSFALAVVTTLVVALAAVAPVSASAAASKDPCGKQLFLDWWDNYRIDRIYPLHCYREAINGLSVDIRQYSRAEEDILRALAYALQNKPDPGDQGAGADEDRSGGNGQGTTTGTGQGDPPSRVSPGPVDTSGPAAVPIPLVALASIAGLLLTLGATGYFKRRLADRREGGPPQA